MNTCVNFQGTREILEGLVARYGGQCPAVLPRERERAGAATARRPVRSRPRRSAVNEVMRGHRGERGAQHDIAALQSFLRVDHILRVAPVCRDLSRFRVTGAEGALRAQHLCPPQALKIAVVAALLRLFVEEVCTCVIVKLPALVARARTPAVTHPLLRGGVAT